MDRLATVVLALLVLVTALGLVFMGTFMSGFGSESHAQFELTADRIQQEHLTSNATGNLAANETVVVDEAKANGTARVFTERLGIDGAYVERNGSFYVVSVSEGEDVHRERPVATYAPVDDPNGSVHSLDSLPSVDRRGFIRAFRQHEANHSLRNIEYVYRQREEIETSIVVSERVSLVAVQNQTFRVLIANDTVRLQSYVYSLERIATNESAFADELVHDAEAQLGSGEARALDEAIEDGSFVTEAGTNAGAWESLAPVGRMCRIDSDSFGHSAGPAVCYVYYDGSYYRLTFDDYDG